MYVINASLPGHLLIPSIYVELGLALVRGLFLSIRTARRLSLAFSTAMLFPATIHVVDEGIKEKGGRAVRWTSAHQYGSTICDQLEDRREDGYAEYGVCFCSCSSISDRCVVYLCYTQQSRLAKSQHYRESSEDVDLGCRIVS